MLETMPIIFAIVAVGGVALAPQVLRDMFAPFEAAGFTALDAAGQADGKSGYDVARN